MKVLHIFPHDILNPKYFYLGNTKDIRGRTEYFMKRNIEYTEIPLKGNRLKFDDILLSKFKKMDLSQYDAIFFEYPIFPSCLLFVSQRYPNIIKIVRSHNAEFLHYMHYAWTCLLHLKKYEYVFTHFLNSFKRLKMDYLTAKRSNYLLSIVQWRRIIIGSILIFQRNYEICHIFYQKIMKKILHPQVKKIIVFVQCLLQKELCLYCSTR